MNCFPEYADIAEPADGHEEDPPARAARGPGGPPRLQRGGGVHGGPRRHQEVPQARPHKVSHLPGDGGPPADTGCGGPARVDTTGGGPAEGHPGLERGPQRLAHPSPPHLVHMTLDI